MIRPLGPLTFLVRVGRQLRYVHIDHLLQTERVNCEEEEEVVPEESSVPVSGSNTPPPPPSVTVSKTTQDQPAETQKPVAEPIPQPSTPDAPAAQEPCSSYISREDSCCNSRA